MKYEFYIDTGDLKWQPGFPQTLSKMICINIIRRKVSNKRGRIKKTLFFPPEQILPVIEETWCYLSEKERKQYIELTNEEFEHLKKLYNV